MKNVKPFTLLDIARVRITLAYGYAQGGASLEYAINSVAGGFEADGTVSPFDCDGFAKALSDAMQSDLQTVDALISALSLDRNGDFHFDARTLKVTTVAGMTLIAPAWKVQLKNGPIAQMWAWWDMRHGLIRNVSYLALVSEGNVASIEYI